MVLGHTRFSDASIGRVVDGTFIATKAGATTVTLTQAATANYRAAELTSTILIKPSVSVKVSKRTITVSVLGAAGKVLINGKPAKIGKNTVTAGKKLVTITIGGKQVYKKSFTVK